MKLFFGGKCFADIYQKRTQVSLEMCPRKIFTLKSNKEMCAKLVIITSSVTGKQKMYTTRVPTDGDRRNDYTTSEMKNTAAPVKDAQTRKDVHGNSIDRFHQLSPFRSLASGGSLEKSTTLISQMLYAAPGLVQAEAKAFSPSEQTNQKNKIK